MEGSQPTASTSKLQDVSDLVDVLASSSTDKLSTIFLNKPGSRDYLSKLTEFSLPQLYGEPTTLQTQSHHLTSSLTSLTHTSYPTFLSLHRTTTALTSSLESLASSLSSLLDTSLPALEESATNWKDRTEEVLRERGRAKVVLDQHEKIRDLLDIPLLIDACVRNGYFAEALSLAAHAKSIAASSSFRDKSPPLILQSVLSEVHTSVTQMLLSLLSTLYEPNRKLPALWKAVNFLRKMDGFGPSSPFASPSSKAKIQIYLSSEHFVSSEEEISSEEQIALAFLIGRESCLKSTLETCGSDVTRLTKDPERVLDDREKEDLARYLKTYIDTWREGAYDIIMQFTTIFLERSSRNGSISSPTVPSPVHQDQEILRLHSLVTTYASHALNAHLLPILTPALPKLSLNLLSSLLTQLTYCSTAFGKVGLDFRSVLSILFSTAILQVVTSDLRSVSTKWNMRLRKASGSGSLKDPTATPSRRQQQQQQVMAPSRWLVTPSAAASPPVPSTAASIGGSPPPPQGPAHIPPQMLASYPPLAEHTNSLLGVFNNLRLLAPVGILPQLIAVIDSMLVDGGNKLLLYLQSFSSSLSHSTAVTEDELDKRRREKKVAVAVGDVYFGTFVPFVKRALVEGVYGVGSGTMGAAGKDEGGERERKADDQIRRWDQLKEVLSA
ncbi:hypothetical protein FA13DRAFT_1724526 [Coprinellus micaceus]|uniref:Conserved oligomeric Golgi complex subunit 8 n=1 Tax=Coprinellus micaceus TaxID=71717 RepID=A0A4Y7TXQ5_COPMI|nr:hypothetical protein FA13DRAFT_1724526 [Coprinellus micaceus]